jgi:chorismate mutase/prephenate dehydratase
MATVAIQGIRGSYGEEAARLLMGAAATIIECEDFEATFEAVETSRAQYAVVPVVNKIVGEIDGTMAILRKRDYCVLDQLPLRVAHVLAGTRDAEFGGLKTVRSHVEALKQCRSFFSANDHLTQLIGADTATSIRRVVEDTGAEHAAIGSRRAAKIYGAKIIAENIADDPDNWTTFYLLRK